MGLADIKYNNIPIMPDGRVALFDLDERNALKGLLSGCVVAERPYGLFNMLPYEWFDELSEEVKNHLEGEKFKIFQGKLPVLKERAKKRADQQELLRQFYSSKGITFPRQFFTYEMKDFSKYPQKVKIAVEVFFNHIAKEIESLDLLDMGRGRKIKLDTQSDGKFFSAIRGKQAMTYMEYRSIQEELLKALEAEGYLFAYKIAGTGNHISAYL
ncbi:MAG: hypothetical protein JSR80_04645 [Verrucomicrobia bacterium]|nr:hypothetical protein [Verrucomicrobiota bacterium]